LVILESGFGVLELNLDGVLSVAFSLSLGTKTDKIHKPIIPKKRCEHPHPDFPPSIEPYFMALYCILHPSEQKLEKLGLNCLPQKLQLLQLIGDMQN